MACHELTQAEDSRALTVQVAARGGCDPALNRDGFVEVAELVPIGLHFANTKTEDLG